MPMRRIDHLGMSAHGKEAYTMAIIGFLTVHGLPATIPSATGAATSSILGSLTPGVAPLRLPAPARSFPSRTTIDAPEPGRQAIGFRRGCRRTAGPRERLPAC